MAGGIPGGPVVKTSPFILFIYLFFKTSPFNAGSILGQGTKISCVTAKKIKT